MTPFEIRKFRKRNKIELLELAAMSGITTALIEQIESEEVVALSSDLVRLEQAMHVILQGRSEDKDDPED